MAVRKLQRNTRQRQVVLEELKKLTSHPTAVDLYEIVRGRLPRISLGTVYRNLELLVQNGVIQKLELGGVEARFDGNPEQHYHARCVCCGRVADVHDLPEDFLVKCDGQHLSGYEILGFRLEFIGICPNCKRRSGNESGQENGVKHDEPKDSGRI